MTSINFEINDHNQIVITVLGVIFNAQNKVLLSLRSDPVFKQTDAKWEIPGGKIEFGETASECLVREVREETGLIVSPETIVNCIWSNIWEKDGGKLQAILIPFICRVESGEVLPSNHEVKKLRWFSLAEIKGLDTLPGVKEIVQTAFYEKRGGQRYERSKDGL